MSVADIFIDIILWVLNSSILKLPESIAILPLSTLQSTITDFINTFAGTFSFLNYFIPIDLAFKLLGAIIIAEIGLHLGWKGVKFIINVFRGSGG